MGKVVKLRVLATLLSPSGKHPEKYEVVSKSKYIKRQNHIWSKFQFLKSKRKRLVENFMERGLSDTKVGLKLELKDIKVEKKLPDCSVVNFCSGFAETSTNVGSKVKELRISTQARGWETTN